MKKKYLLLALIQILFTSSVFISCEGASSRDFDMMQDNRAYLNALEKKLNNETDKFANSEEWLTFRWENEQKIIVNEEKIKELEKRLDKVGKPIDNKSKKLYNILHVKNLFLKSKLDTYENDQSQGDWVSFKRQYEFEMKDFEMRLKVLLEDRNYL